MRLTFALTTTVALFLVLGCRESNSRQQAPTKTATGTVVIYTVNYPLKYFADRIGGDHVRVEFPVPSDTDPAFWTPDAETVSAYQQAELILLNGATYAKWVPKVTLPSSKLVNTTRLVKDRFITIKDAITHSHGPGEQHSHVGTAFTTWLDPELAIAQSKAIYEALSKARPAHKETFSQNFESLKSDLQALDDKLRVATTNASNQPVVFSHPVFQYLERKYGLSARSVDWEPDTPPTDGDWSELREMLKSHAAKWMIWEGAPIQQSVEQLEQLGMDSVMFDPCGNTPASGDWLDVMNRNAEALSEVYSTE